MILEIVSSGTPGGTFVRDIETKEIVDRVVSVDIHLGIDSTYATICVNNPIVKYIGDADVHTKHITVEKSHENAP